jgi:hypothetical protein
MLRVPQKLDSALRGFDQILARQAMEVVLGFLKMSTLIYQFVRNL